MKQPKINDDIQAFGFDDGLERKILTIDENQPFGNQGIYVVYDQFAEQHYVEDNALGAWEGLNPFQFGE